MHDVLLYTVDLIIINKLSQAFAHYLVCVPCTVVPMLVRSFSSLPYKRLTCMYAWMHACRYIHIGADIIDNWVTVCGHRNSVSGWSIDQFVSRMFAVVTGETVCVGTCLVGLAWQAGRVVSLDTHQHTGFWHSACGRHYVSAPRTLSISPFVL